MRSDGRLVLGGQGAPTCWNSNGSRRGTNQLDHLGQIPQLCPPRPASRHAAGKSLSRPPAGDARWQNPEIVVGNGTDRGQVGLLPPATPPAVANRRKISR